MAMSNLATFGGGCFWGVEETFRELPGVIKTGVGYMGGHTKNPAYEDVCSHTTGHAEVVNIEFNPNKISYEDLLKVFFRSHNPTEVNRQGPDIGDQYRSVIFYNNEDQKNTAEKYIKELEDNKKYDQPIATIIEPTQVFYRAEEYHQQYLAKKGLKICH